MRFAVASAALLFIWASPVAADLYRWVDPESGSVKFSSYPPPWYRDAAKQGRAPDVEHIPAGKPAPASGTKVPESKAAPKPAPESAAKLQAPANSAMEERRKVLLKQISAHLENLAASKPEESARIYSELAEQVREHNSAELFLKQVDSGGEAARQAQWNEVGAGLEGRRRRMLEQIAATRVPAEGTPPDNVRNAWQELGRHLASFGWVDNALKLFDPKGAQIRDAEQAALTEALAQQWKPLLDANLRRPGQ